ncbi:precursor of cep5 [Quercus suber]|uniref:Precursor of cep5 n=1 Tax=Quercus suber TaxID=58331 RepID=A0AAW0KZ02_QUESU
MANATRTCLCFLLIILCHELLCIEGRNLNPRKKLKCAKCLSPNTTGIATKARKTAASPSSAKTTNDYVDAFRPTTPGHSPGVGHSIQN